MLYEVITYRSACLSQCHCQFLYDPRLVRQQQPGRETGTDMESPGETSRRTDSFPGWINTNGADLQKLFGGPSLVGGSFYFYSLHPRDVVREVVLRGEFVITSYSIHYTKLYDEPGGGRPPAGDS